MQNGPIITQNTELMFLLNQVVNHYTGIEMAAKQAAGDYKIYGTQIKRTTEKLREETQKLRDDFSFG